MLSILQRITRPKGVAEFVARERGRAIVGVIPFYGEFSFENGANLVLEQHPRAKDIRFVRVRYTRAPA